MHTDAANRLGEYLKTLRKSTGLSQEKVASEIGVIQQSYSHYETGRVIPPMQTLMALSQFFDVPLEDLLPLSDSKPQSNDVTKDKKNTSINATDYIAYINQPVNESRLRFLNEKEKKLLYYFSVMDTSEKDDYLELFRMRTEERRTKKAKK